MKLNFEIVGLTVGYFIKLDFDSCIKLSNFLIKSRIPFKFDTYGDDEYSLQMKESEDRKSVKDLLDKLKTKYEIEENRKE